MKITVCGKDKAFKTMMTSGILMIVDPSFESLRLSAKIADLSTSIGKPIWFCLNKVTEENAQMMEEEVGKHGAIIGRMPLDHDLGLAGLTGTELQMTIAPISEMAQFLIQSPEDIVLDSI